MVSIVIPVYNGLKYIDTCIESCINQTYHEIEIIIIDDGSTDGLSNSDIKSNDSRIKFFSKENEGLGKTRNFGIEKSQGEYIFFLDVDDTIPNSAIELLILSIKENDIAIGKCERIFFNKHNTVYKSSIWKEKIYDKVKDKYDLILDTIATNKLYKKSFLLKNNIFFEEGLYEDKLFVLKVLENLETFIIVNQIVYIWRVETDGNSITNQITIENLKERVKVLYKCIKYTSNNKAKCLIIENTIKHDLKIYVNASYAYDLKELLELYTIYAEFTKKYKTYIDKISFKQNKAIIQNISYKYSTINTFLQISYKKNHIDKQDRHYRYRDIILKIFLKLEKFGINL